MAFILVVPVACAGESLALPRVTSPPATIAGGRVVQASHNYLVFVKVAVKLTAAVFSVNSSPITAMVVKTARGFAIFANFAPTEDLRAKVAATLSRAFSVAQLLAIVALA